MTMYYKPAEPGVMLETGFGQECHGQEQKATPPQGRHSEELRFDNMVLEIWSDPEITAETGYEYTRAIQFQCLGGGGEAVWCFMPLRARLCVIGHK